MNNFFERLKSQNVFANDYLSARNVIIFANKKDINELKIITKYQKGNIQILHSEQLDDIMRLNNCSCDCFIIWLGVADPNRIKYKILKKGIRKIYIMSVSLLNIIHALYYFQYLLEQEIDVSDTILDVKGMKIYNPFHIDNQLFLKYAFEAGDSILPWAFNDYSLVLEGPYEYEDVRIRPGNVVVDAGANIGIFSIFALMRQCVVHTFEPIIDTFALLMRNLSLYDCKNYRAICAGLADRSEKVRFSVNTENSAANSMIIPQRNGHYEWASITSLDEYVYKNNIKQLDFIKADIEGAERLMLRGARETIRTFRPMLSLCTYHNSDDPVVLERMIREINPEYHIIHKWWKLYAYI